jgi:hypothetical protein
MLFLSYPPFVFPINQIIPIVSNFWWLAGHQLSERWIKNFWTNFCFTFFYYTTLSDNDLCVSVPFRSWDFEVKLAYGLGYSDFHNLMGFTSKRMPNNIL